MPLVVNADPRVATDAAGYARKLEFTLPRATRWTARPRRSKRCARSASRWPTCATASRRTPTQRRSGTRPTRSSRDATPSKASLHNPKAEVVYDILSGREGGAKLYSQISPLYDWIQSADLPPTQGMTDRLAFVTGELRRVEGEVAALRAGEVVRFEAAVASANLPRVIVP